MTSTPSPTQHLRENLYRHSREALRLSLAQRLSADPSRAKRCRIAAGSLHIDYSRSRTDDTTLALLIEYAEACKLPRQIARMFAGESIGSTEDRPALHWAWRAGTGEGAGGKAIQASLARLEHLATALHAGQLQGFTGRPLSHVVNIGIGGSDMGVRLLCDALSGWRTRTRTKPHTQAHPITVDFLSNIDPKALRRVLHNSDPETTLFVVCSRSFTTEETRRNASRVQEWLLAAAQGKDISGQIFAVTEAPPAAVKFGIPPEQVLTAPGCPAGRYSLWSPMALSAVLFLGFAPFRALLAGAERVDRHFRSAPLADNAPVLLGLLDVWNHSFCGLSSLACIPYDEDLALLPTYLRQLLMESNGKGTSRSGDAAWASAPVVWGGVGSDSQHSFGQFLHQGPASVAVDFLAPLGDHASSDDDASPGPGLDDASPNSSPGSSPDDANPGPGPAPEDTRQHAMLFANCLAQAQVLMQGWQDRDPHKSLPGDRPSSLILYPRLDPGILGSLLALYEHRCFVQSVLWNVNPFDQWGVERGKRVAGDIEKRLLGEGNHDDGTGSFPADAASEENIALYLKHARR